MRFFAAALVAIIPSMLIGQNISPMDSAESSYRLGLLERSLTWLDKVPEESRNTSYYYLRGQSLNRLNRPDEAWESCTEVLRLDSNYVPGMVLSAEVAGRVDRDTVALVLWQKLVRRFPKSSRYHRQFAGTAMRLGVLPLAIYHYEQAITLNPYDISSLAQVVELYEGLQNFDRADSLVRAALKTQPDREELYLLGARAAYRAQDYYKAVQYLRHVDSTSTLNATWNEIYGISLYRAHYIDESIPILKRLHPSDAEEGPTYVMAMAFYRLEQYDSAACYFEMAADLGTSTDLPVYYEFAGRSHQAAGRPMKAVEAYEESYRYDPEDPVFTYLIARAYDEAGDREQAAAYYKSYVERETDHESDYYLFAVDRLTEWRREDFFRGK